MVFIADDDTLRAIVEYQDRVKSKTGANISRSEAIRALIRKGKSK
jgi:hypothetical protein